MRLFKNGNKAICEVKASSVIAKKDFMVGKLTSRDKMTAQVKPEKEVKQGDKFLIRAGYKRPDGKYLVYLAYGLGWIICDKLEDLFQPCKANTDMYQVVYNRDEVFQIEEPIVELTREEKIIKLLESSTIELTKTEQMLLAFLRNEDLKETEKRIHCDKSLKYKIKNHTEKYITDYERKLENINSNIQIA